ncbi:hypothetical protein ACU8KH_04561 [Lachancea thermotolerans]
MSVSVLGDPSRGSMPFVEVGAGSDDSSDLNDFLQLFDSLWKKSRSP